MAGCVANSTHRSFRWRLLGLAFVLAVFLGDLPTDAQNEAPAVVTDQSYHANIRPLLKQLCFDCHSGDNTEADVDLAEFATVDDLRRQTKAWVKIRDMLDSRQMPPKDSPKPTDDEQKLLSNWVREFLLTEARKHAGDPGPVILRRLCNDEYNYSVRDLTGVASLNPTREFPVDGAAGEGFTNSGAAQSMSPALVTKYLDAGKEVASHAVLTPDGIRFSPSTTQRDHTDELLARIQQFYRPYTEDSGNTSVTLQGIKLSTSDGGRLPVSRYIDATLQERDALRNGTTTLTAVAHKRALNEKYLTTLWNALTTSNEPSMMLDQLRRSWETARMEDSSKLIADIDAAQESLWKFNSIGQAGREGGAITWQEAVSPLTERHELRHKIADAVPNSEITLWLTVNDLGDGNADDFAVFEQPRFEFPLTTAGEPLPPIELRNVRSLVSGIKSTIAQETPRTAEYLAAAIQLRTSQKSVDESAKAANLNVQLLEQWTRLLGLDHRAKREVTGHFTTKLLKGRGYDAINGWGGNETPNLLTNNSNDPISFLTLTIPARGVTVHPSPTLESVVAWRCPVNTKITVNGLVADADNKCGNGAIWRVQLQTESGTASLASGVLDNGGEQKFQATTEINMREGDIVSLIVNPRDGSHSCDTTHVVLNLSEADGQQRVWNLATDVVDRILESNPLPDSYGHAGTWHFGAQPISPATSIAASALVPGSTLAKLRAAVLDGDSDEEIQTLSLAIQAGLTSANPSALNDADRRQREQVLDWRGALRWIVCSQGEVAGDSDSFGVAPEKFGRHPDGTALRATDLCLKAPQILELRLPASLLAGSEFVTTATLHASTARKGTVQAQLATTKPAQQTMSLSTPILVEKDARPRVEAALNDLRDLFPEALCYARIVPVDEVVTLNLFYREDNFLQRLMLNEEESAELDRLWDELFFVAREPLQLAVSYEQLYEFATQDRPDIVIALESSKATQRTGREVSRTDEGHRTRSPRRGTSVRRSSVATAAFSG
jgi:RNAse (barnase) inhibitor barstar